MGQERSWGIPLKLVLLSKLYGDPQAQLQHPLLFAHLSRTTDIQKVQQVLLAFWQLCKHPDS
jgi:hypothetical protein